jgi:putative FmdB family regulatory protein
MPIYEYRCMKCRNEFEEMQKFSDTPVSRCPSCGGKAKRLISRSSFQLKGSGWYLTDYVKKGSPRDSRESTGSSESTTDPTPPASTASSSDD